MDKGFALLVVTFNSLINGFFMEGNTIIRGKHRRFLKMVEKGLALEIVSYITFVDGYCKRGNMREAFSLLYELTSKGLPLDVITCSVRIQGLCKERRIEETCKLFEKKCFRVV